MGGRSWSSIGLIFWFGIYGILAVTNITFALSNVVLGLLAIFIAICFTFGK